MKERKFRLEYLYPNFDSSILNELEFCPIKDDIDKLGILPGEETCFDAIHITSKEYFHSAPMDHDHKKNWKHNLIKKGAQKLAELPEYLPSYISWTARMIILELLGISPNPTLDTYLNKQGYYLQGKSHLSIFLCVIEELEKCEINLEELPVNFGQFAFRDVIRYLDFYKCNENIEYAIEQVSYDTEDYYKNYPIIKKYCSYKDLKEFFKNVMEIINKTETNALLPNPETLDFEKNRYFLDDIFNEMLSQIDEPFSENIAKQKKQMLLQLPKGELVSANALIEKVLNTIHIGAKKAEQIVCINKLKGILKSLRNSSDQKQIDSLVSDMNDLINQLELFKNRNDLKSYFEKFMKEMNFTTEEKERINKILQEGSTENLFKTKKDLLEEIDTLKKEREELKGLLYDFLDHGENISKIFKRKNLSNKELKKMLSEYNSKRASSFIRKKILMAALCLSVFGNLLSMKHIFGSKNDTYPISSTTAFSTTDIPIQDEIPVQNEIPETISDKKQVFPHTAFKEHSYREEKTQTVSSLDSTQSDLPIEQVEQEIYLGKKIELENVPYYKSIYDKTPLGNTSQNGDIIAYFPYLQKENQNIFLASLRSQKEVSQFITQNIDHMKEISWKVAVASPIDYEKIKLSLDLGQAIDYRYTIFFTDFEPNFEKEKSLSLSNRK